MTTIASEALAPDLGSESTWQEYYPLLQSLARRFVYAFDVSCWHGQEGDIIEDIVQEAARRVLEHRRRVERGEVAPIHSLAHMIWTIVYHCCIDKRRHDQRLVRMTTEDDLLDFHATGDDLVDLAEAAIENAYREEIFMLLAREIARFPYKQRNALLIDLANLTCFDEAPLPLQEAFLTVDIQLRDYQQPLPVNAVERARHASLLHQAYKRVARLLCIRQYVLAT
jgi:DNA-directed RNA polymerase specialized sigma24 family protein